MDKYSAEFKVMKSDCTSLIGLIVSDGTKCIFIEKKDLSDYEYSNIIIGVNGSIYVTAKTGLPRRGYAFTRRNDRLIIESEWNAIRLKTNDKLPDVNGMLKTIYEVRNFPSNILTSAGKNCSVE